MTISTSYSSGRSLQTYMASRFETLRLWRAVFISIAVFALLFTSVEIAKAQNSIHGSTSASQAPGSPSGSYALTGFENINLFNGHLNFHLPLLSIGGRGESGYSGNTITVTDQAGKRRKSVTDTLGRLVEVYEDPLIPGGPTELDFQTVYSYDTLDNLVKVTQGSQQRFFMYDSLKRLIRSRIPEQGTPAGLSLSDPITGNSAWSIGYQYDSGSNLTQKTDARGVMSTYVYDALLIETPRSIILTPLRLFRM